MSSAKRSTACALMLLAGVTLAGCGFHSVYGSSTGAQTVVELAQVRINPIPDRVGQVLRNYLSDRMEPTGLGSTRYTLDVALGEQRADLGIQQNSTVTFSRLTLTATYLLKDATTGAVLLSGNARADNSYNQLEGGFPSLSAQDDARSRAAQTVGDEIVTRLSLFLKNRAT